METRGQKRLRIDDVITDDEEEPEVIESARKRRKTSHGTFGEFWNATKHAAVTLYEYFTSWSETPKKMASGKSRLNAASANYGEDDDVR